MREANPPGWVVNCMGGLGGQNNTAEKKASSAIEKFGQEAKARVEAARVGAELLVPGGSDFREQRKINSLPWRRSYSSKNR